MFTQAYQQQPVFIGSQNATHSHPPPGVAPGNQMLNQLETLNLNNMGIGHEVVNAIKAIFSVCFFEDFLGPRKPGFQLCRYSIFQALENPGAIRCRTL